MKIVICGDLCPIGAAKLPFIAGEVESVLNEVHPILHEADLTVANLECCLADNETPIEKDGPLLSVPTGCARGIEAAGINIVGLANNHILDQGEAGLVSTIDALHRLGIDYFGAGPNLDAAGNLLVREICGMRIAFLGMAEHEFSIAGVDSWGANPVDIVQYVRKVRRCRDQYDFLIVLFHGGLEHYPYPTPAQMELCRFMIEEGAGAVICQHSHCSGCYEIYQGSPIVYGQGNFIFDRRVRHSTWYSGFLASLTINHNLKCEVELIPFSQFHSQPCLSLLRNADLEAYIDAVEARSKSIQQEGFTEKAWLDHCRDLRVLYFSRLHGHNRLLRFMNRTFRFSEWLYSREVKLMMRNVVECETHREVLETLWRCDKIRSKAI